MTRDRRAITSAAAAIASKALGLVTLIVSVPIIIRAVGVEAYGLWMSAASLLSLLAFADLGIGSSLVSPLADAEARGDAQRGRAISTNALAIVAVTSLAIGIAFFAVWRFVDWNALLSATRANGRTAGIVALLLATSLWVNAASTMAKAQSAVQEQYVTHAWEATGSALTLGLLWLIVALELPVGIFGLIAIVAGIPPLMLTASGARLLYFRRPHLAPRREAIRRDVSAELLRRGAFFVLLQLASALTFSSDTFIVGRLLGPAAAATFAVPWRLFAMVHFGAALLLLPLWPAYADALSRGDRAWVRRTFILSLVVAVLGSGIAGAVLFWFGPNIVALWTGAAVAPPRSLLLAMAVLTVLMSAGTALSMILFGAGRIRWLAVCGSVMSVAAVAAKVLCGLRWGMTGVVAGTAAVYLVLNLIPCAIYLRVKGVA